MTEESPGPASGEVLPPDWPDESAERLSKAAQLRSLGVELYPNRFERTHSLVAIAAEYGDKSLEELEALRPAVRVAGRVLLKRPHGKASFATLGGDAELQIYVRQNDVGEEAYRLFDLVDRGDFLGVAGRVMRTRKGELSVQAESLQFLSKALLPPPEKWHGLADVETRYRQRYVDLSSNPDSRRVFLTRSKVVSEMRRFLDAQGYVEVETPMMQPIAGGALARPFVTHHNTLGVDLYLRVAPELYLKRLVVGGLERVYEINRNFRNEGISSMHNPEFTMLEFYTAYFDCRDVMRITEELLVAAARRVVPERRLTYQDQEIDFAPPFRRVSMSDAVIKALREHVDSPTAATLTSPESLAAVVSLPAFAETCRARGADASEYKGLGRGKTIMRLFEDFVERSLVQPTFVVDYPIEVSPLSKARSDRPEFADRFELYIAGMEIANGFSELNDPLEQRSRFLQQQAERAKGDTEAHPVDDDYIRALGHGMPPTGGCGVGVDRLTMILTNSPSIRDVILFPQMRPEGGRQEGP